MSQWLNDVVNDSGEWCRNCSELDAPIWRVLHGREIERCPNCGYEVFDVYDFDDDDPY